MADEDTTMQDTMQEGNDLRPPDPPQVSDTTRPPRSAAAIRGDVAPDGSEAHQLAPPTYSLRDIQIHYGYQLASVEDIWASTDGTNYRAWDTLVREMAYVQAPDDTPAPGVSRPMDILSILPATRCHQKLYSKACQITGNKNRTSQPHSNLPSGLDQKFSEWRVFVSTDKKVL